MNNLEMKLLKRFLSIIKYGVLYDNKQREEFQKNVDVFFKKLEEVKGE